MFIRFFITCKLNLFYSVDCFFHRHTSNSGFRQKSQRHSKWNDFFKPFSRCVCFIFPLSYNIFRIYCNILTAFCLPSTTFSNKQPIKDLCYDLEKEATKCKHDGKSDLSTTHLETMKKKSEATKSTNYHGKHIQQLFNVDA